MNDDARCKCSRVERGLVDVSWQNEHGKAGDGSRAEGKILTEVGNQERRNG
jgi:hypothetical protein